jgi:myo-inositol-1(or 4)-monophosphatase
LGPSAVSIALWAAQKPMFGVVYDLHDRQLVWGGAGLDAYANGMRIRVSDVSSLGQASLCTGFPARFDFAIEPGMNDFWRLASTVGKIRMLGSASVSLLHVARGSADAYAERSIMLWDVAAGLAIVEGAGGSHVATQTNVEWSYNVIASNTNLISGLSKT